MQIPRLRRWRERQGLTQKDLAELAGVSERSVAGYEGGESTRPNTARKLADALNVTVADLIAEPFSLEWALDPSVSSEEYKAAMAQASVEDYTRLRRQLRQQGQWVEVEPARIGDAPRRMKVLHPLVVERLRAAPPITLFEMEVSDEGNRCVWYIPRPEWELHRVTVDEFFDGEPYIDVDAREGREKGQAKSKVHKKATVYAAA